MRSERDGVFAGLQGETTLKKPPVQTGGFWGQRILTAGD
jgi:hypothetical protein